MGVILSTFLTVSLLAVIPFTGSVDVFGQSASLQMIDLKTALLFIAAVWFLTGVLKILDNGDVGEVLVNNVNSELAAVVSILSIVVMSGTLSISDVIKDQGPTVWNWYFIKNPISFLIVLVAILNRCRGDEERMPAYEYLSLMITGLITAAIFLGGYEFPFMNAQMIRENTFVIFNMEWPVVGVMLLVAGGFLIRSKKLRRWVAYVLGAAVILIGVAVLGTFLFFSLEPLPEWTGWLIHMGLQVAMLFGKAIIVCGLIMWLKEKDWVKVNFGTLNKYILPISFLNIIVVSVAVYLMR